MTYNYFHNAKKSIFFDGTNDYLEIANQGNGVANLNPNNDEAFSISAWIKQETVTSYRIIWSNQEAGSPYTGWALYINAGELVFHAYEDGAASRYITAASHNFAEVDLMWQNITATYSGNSTQGGMKLYVNGAYVTPTYASGGSSQAIGTIDSEAPISIGRSAWASYFSGHICNVGFWNKELSATDVRNVYKGRGAAVGPGDLNKHPASSNLVSWWLADNPADTYNGTIYDEKGSFNMTPNNLASDALIDLAP
jgi:hypothetical protein